MAVAAYYSWDRLGRPLNPAQPIRELVNALKAGYPAAAAQNLFSWYADEAHYQANFPEDHTPYSYTGWPEPNPQWWVCATDIMHRPDLGVDCKAIFAHLLESAKAGLTPWLKYIIWQARLYHISNEWRPQANSGHFDHIHISTRTDHLEASLNGWSPIPGGADDMTPEQAQQLKDVWSALFEDAMPTDRPANSLVGLVTTPSDAINLVLKGASRFGAAKDHPDPQIRDHVPGNDLRSVEGRLSEQAEVDVTVDADAVAAALAANPDFMAAIKQAAFEGAQRAEGE